MGYVFPDSYFPGRYWPVDYWPDAGTAPPAPDYLPDRSWVNGFYALILVADNNGRLVGELQADIESLAWVLNKFGQARLNVPSPGTAAELMELGNRVIVYVDNGLPPWAGFFDPPRRSRFGSVTLGAYSGERLMTHRLTGRDRTFSRATAGAILTALLAEQAGPPVVEAGYIDLGGQPLSDSYHLQKLYEVLQSDPFRAAADWNVSASIEGGRLRFRVNLYQRRGRDLPNIWLVDGHNTEPIEVEDQGPIVNEWLVAGPGNGWGANSRPYSQARDDDSVGRFGLRQDSKVYGNSRDGSMLDYLVAGELEVSAAPYAAYSVGAINLPPALFSDYDIGDSLGVELVTTGGGRRESRRVIGREFRPSDGLCEVVLT